MADLVRVQKLNGDYAIVSDEEAQEMRDCGELATQEATTGVLTTDDVYGDGYEPDGTLSSNWT